MTKNDIEHKYNELMSLYWDLKDDVRRMVADNAYKRWKAGGFRIDSADTNMYPDLGRIIDTLEEDDDEGN